MLEAVWESLIRERMPGMSDPCRRALCRELARVAKWCALLTWGGALAGVRHMSCLSSDGGARRMWSG